MPSLKLAFCKNVKRELTNFQYGAIIDEVEGVVTHIFVGNGQHTGNFPWPLLNDETCVLQARTTPFYSTLRVSLTWRFFYGILGIARSCRRS